MPLNAQGEAPGKFRAAAIVHTHFEVYIQCSICSVSIAVK